MQASFHHLLLSCILRNLRIVDPSSSEEKSHTVRDQGNKLVAEVPEYDFLRGNLTPVETNEQMPYNDGVIFPATESFEYLHHELHSSAVYLNWIKPILPSRSYDTLHLFQGKWNNSFTFGKYLKCSGTLWTKVVQLPH
ncbi:hypothetical protein AVEN_114858-1 [Araneus ventricosus]|uniref:Uncharacterized protein n=1 Tax=Araneus ventricosus TaxID=182803 RepID=A0A4Y2QYT2_ARAVE|nr:hypothetical protein AVEN_114858-1 [Araneus ventricosus]